MSTKTTIKRIALVAVAALGFGIVSTVSAQATEGDIVAASGFTFGGSATAATITTTAGANNYVGFTLATASTDFLVTVTGGTASSAATTVTGSGTASLVVTRNSGTTAFTVPTTTVGTITVKAYAFTAGVAASTSTSKLTITVNAAATGVGTLSVGNSTSYITESATVTAYDSGLVSATNAATAWGNLSADDTTAVSKGTAGSPAIAAVIVGKLLDSQVPTPAAMTSKTLTATITGSGLITGNSAADGALSATPARVASTVTGSSNGVFAFGVYSDGSSGVGTITISYTDALNVTTTVATETITFYGSAASFTATQYMKYIPNSGSMWPDSGPSSATGDKVVKIAVKDSAGNPVGGVTPSIKTADADSIYISGGTCTASSYTTGSSYCSLTGVSGAVDKAVVVTFYTGAAATYNYVSADITVTVVNPKAATFDVTAEKSVTSGNVITYTITAKDASGNPIPDGSSVLNYLYSSPTIAGGAMKDYSSVLANNVDALFTGAKFSSGVATDSVQAPFGTTSIVATFDGNGAGVATSGGTYFTTAALRNFETVLTTSVSADPGVAAATSAATDAVDAANEATDAANAATDAANAAAEAADAATAAAQDAQAAVAALASQVADLVAGLKAQITALTNLVIKIQKKVKA